jgi:hypothetical protein
MATLPVHHHFFNFFLNLAGAAKDSLWRDKEGYILIKIKEDLEM